MKIKKIENNWYVIFRSNLLRDLLRLKPKTQKIKHLEGNVFPHAPHVGVYMDENGKILSPFYDRRVTFLDNYRMKLRHH